MGFPRKVESELLDQLPADDPRAVRARRDLMLVNVLMRNAVCMASILSRLCRTRRPRTIIDLGSGDGRHMLQVARLLSPRWRDVKLILQDRQDIVSSTTREHFAVLHWQVETVCADVFDFLARAPRVDAFTVNMFLHHFPDEQLARLLAAMAQRTSLAVACEPRRAKRVVQASRLMWMIGIGDTIIHDGIASANAGFKDKELSALWPRDGDWELHEHLGAIFTHSFAARRLVPAAHAS